MTKLKFLLTSRKFWAAVIGLGLIIVKAYRPDFPLTSDQMTTIVVVLVGYIVGTAIEDSSAARVIPPKDSASGPPPPAG
jgi:hydrogenase/urease accessory protein HupE